MRAVRAIPGTLWRDELWRGKHPLWRTAFAPPHTRNVISGAGSAEGPDVPVLRTWIASGVPGSVCLLAYPFLRRFGSLVGLEGPSCPFLSVLCALLYSRLLRPWLREARAAGCERAASAAILREGEPGARVGSGRASRGPVAAWRGEVEVGARPAITPERRGEVVTPYLRGWE